MQFLVIAYDYKDPDAYQRRMDVRQQHIELCDRLRAEKKMFVGAALMDESREKMIGSAMLFDFADEAELQNWLATEPYAVHKVWESIDIKPCNLGPSFKDLL